MMNNVSLVSCYYRFKSKHSFEAYDKYIDNLLLNYNGNIIIYTSNDLVEYFNKFKKERIKIIILEFEDLPIYNKYIKIWEEQEKKDKQLYTGRNYKCYVIWNSKLYFLINSININPFNSEKFMWFDIGAIRSNNTIELVKKIPVYENISNNKIDITLLNDFMDPKQNFFQDEVHLSGSIFGGGINVINKLYNLYYNKFEEYLNNNRFIGCDQQIMASIYLENKNLFNIINPKENNITENNKIIKKNNKIDPWFYLVYFFSQ